MKKGRQHFYSLIQKHPGYSQIPNFLYALNLSKHALLVFLYLIRCANREKGGICFPSIETICKNCGIASPTSARDAIKELIKKELITKRKQGRKNIYQIFKYVYSAIDYANKKDCEFSELEDISPHSDAIEDEDREYTPIETLTCPPIIGP